MFKRYSFLFCFIAVMLFLSGYKYPDNLPSWQKMHDFKTSNMFFEKTTIDEFKKLCPNIKKEIIDNNNVYFRVNSSKSNDYGVIRVGFLDEKLDWLEFNFRKPINYKKFIDIYGKPRDINTEYSNKYDYLDYNFFNVAVDKRTSMATSISVFEIPTSLTEGAVIVKDETFLSNIDIASYLNLIPGKTLESEFKQQFPDIQAIKINKYSTDSNYIIDKGLGRAKIYFKEAIVRFENGLLLWVNIIPHNMKLNEILSAYQGKYDKEVIDNKYMFYYLKDMTLVVNRVNNKILYIGITS